ncbi:MAG: FAD/NAD-binding family oxidoreductase [Proteobacteria bacterium]|nr:FAD/NAD-binding family oxidoreductase [Pseudomonadota bacterium]
MSQDDALIIVKVEKENDDTTSIYFTGPDMERFKNRKPGQYAAIRIYKDGGWSAPHPFTLSSSPSEETLRMTIKKSGEFTSSIPDIEPGTPIQCSGPYGQFCKDIATSKEIVMIAGGVGITPFLSVLRHFRETVADNQVTLFWANKTPDDAFAAKELEEFTRHLKLSVVHVFSRVAPADQTEAPEFTDNRPGKISHEYGRLNQAMFLRHITSVNASFYLCGPPAMQQTVLEELSLYGVEPGKVDKEAFVFSPKTK